MAALAIPAYALYVAAGMVGGYVGGRWLHGTPAAPPLTTVTSTTKPVAAAAAAATATSSPNKPAPVPPPLPDWNHRRDVREKARRQRIRRNEPIPENAEQLVSELQRQGERPRRMATPRQLPRETNVTAEIVLQTAKQRLRARPDPSLTESEAITVASVESILDDSD